jgi:hypothetical protein
VALVLPVPLGDMLPALAISLLAISILAQDGLWPLAGLGTAAVSAIVVSGAGSGLSEKAYPRAKPGSADLFDARSESQATALAADVQRQLTACGSSPASSR